MNSPDQDFRWISTFPQADNEQLMQKNMYRYMALNDLMNQVKSDPVSLTADEMVERKVLHHVMKLVEDKISEVKNQAVKWYVSPG